MCIRPRGPSPIYVPGINLCHIWLWQQPIRASKKNQSIVTHKASAETRLLESPALKAALSICPTGLWPTTFFSPPASSLPGPHCVLSTRWVPNWGLCAGSACLLAYWDPRPLTRQEQFCKQMPVSDPSLAFKCLPLLTSCFSLKRCNAHCSLLWYL